jgi:hypothetical protein
MFDFKRMSSGLVLGSVLGTCLVTQGVSAVDEVSNVSTQVNDDVDSSEGNKKIVEESAGSDSVAAENVATEDKKTESVNAQVNTDVDSSEGNREVVEDSTGLDSVAAENVGTEDKNTEIVNKQVNDDVDSSEGDKEIVKSPTGSGDVVDEDDDTEDKNDVTYDPSSGEASGSGVYTSEKSSVDDGGSLVKYLFAGVFGAIVGNASLIGMNSFLGGKK